MRRSAPRPFVHAIGAVRERVAPATPLAAVQAVWADVVGAAIAAAAEPLEDRNGVLTVRCESAVWAEELDLMQEAVLERLRARLGESAPRRLRCVTAPRHLAG